MIPRILEHEVMDTAHDAREYNSMDHTAVNTLFVTDLVRALTDWSLQRLVPLSAMLEVLDLGAGTAQIPIELARRATHLHITAVDAAESMLALANLNITTAGLTDRITIVHADAKKLAATQSGARFDTASYEVVISNSIFHHIPDPREVIAEAIRVTAPGGLLFHRDLCRPHDEAELDRIANTYAADATPYQRKLFTDSLHAALTLDEMQHLVADFGFAPETVRMTSDRHWTWTAST